MLEINYICWYEGQNEKDGKNIKAEDPKAAARKAVDIWRHENLKELPQNNIMVVYLKDQDGKITKVNLQ